ncbi:hypothetical protein SynRCC2555_02157 [Synechococcus sp. WH 8101]|nr:hypothetical protein SynRCC2555_02157 [Synechococcus sp. WH 8101]
MDYLSEWSKATGLESQSSGLVGALSISDDLDGVGSHYSGSDAITA